MNKNIDYMEIFIADKKAMITTMYRNMCSDLECGYNPMGQCIQQQKAMITAYEEKFSNELEMFKEMTESQCNRWCYLDLLKRGAIE